MGKAFVKYQLNKERGEFTLRIYYCEGFAEALEVCLHKQFFNNRIISYYMPFRLINTKILQPVIYIDGILYNDTMPLNKTMAQKIEAGKRVFFGKLKNVNNFTEPFFVKTYY